MHPRRRRNYYVSSSCDGRKYEKKVKLKAQHRSQDILNEVDGVEVNPHVNNTTPETQQNPSTHVAADVTNHIAEEFISRRAQDLHNGSSSVKTTISELVPQENPASQHAKDCLNALSEESFPDQSSHVAEDVINDIPEELFTQGAQDLHNESTSEKITTPEPVPQETPSNQYSEGGQDNRFEERFPDLSTSWNNFFKIFSEKHTKEFQVHSKLLTAEILFMILNYYIRHHLTQEAVEDLLRLMNVIAGTKAFPESFQTFSSIFNAYSCSPVRIYFCSNCQYDYGENLPETTTICPVCESPGNDFFLILPVEPQLRETFEKYEHEIEDYAQLIMRDEIADVNRGNIARNLYQNESEKYLTLSINTDGAAAFRSTTRKPLYPIFFTLNNLPPGIRFQKSNLMVAGLWLSIGDPNPNLLFKYFCLELRKLQEGILIGGERYKVVLLQNCLDSVARCKVQCSKQFNGEYGCTLCLHPGETKSNRNGRCYPHKPAEMRDSKATRKIMDVVNRTGQESYGIMGKSVFTYIEKFDIIAGYPVDYMHAVDLGAIKQILALYTETENHKQEYYIGRQIQVINERLQSFRPPSSFPRNPRPLDEQKKYKANEWEALLLYYVYPCLYGILKLPFLDHVMELSSVIFLLLEPSLTLRTIDACERRIDEFVRQFETHFGRDNMTYNIHLLTHLGYTARNTGALYNSSLYPYESGNGMLLNFRSGNNKPIIQIERKYRLNRLVHMTRTPKDSIIYPWIQSLWTRNHPSAEYDFRFLFSVDLNIIFEEGIFQSEFSTQSKVYFNGLSFCTKLACQNFQYDDSWIWKNGHFYSIQSILSDKQNNPYFVGKELTVETISDNLYTYDEIRDDLRIMKFDNSIRQCINMVIKHECKKIKFIAKCKVITQTD